MSGIIRWLFKAEDSYLLPTELPWREMLECYGRRLAILVTLAAACLLMMGIAGGIGWLTK